MNEIYFVILGIVGGILVAWLAIHLFIRNSKKNDTNSQSFLMLQNQLNDLMAKFDARITTTQKETQEATRHQFTESQKLLKNVTEELTHLKETNRQVVSFADQLQNLQDILQNPKRRGVLGEYYLETVLKNVLPPSTYQMQYKVGRSDEGQDLIVDAAIFYEEKIIPIDSKFSLENYNRLAKEHDEAEQQRLERLFKQDLKMRIDETSKYVRPEDGTMDFALMFIPSESIFYDLTVGQVGKASVSTEELIQYAARKHVNIVSPNSFYAFLQVILQGLKQVEIEKNTEIIQKRVGELGKHLKSYDSYHQKLGNTLRTTVNHYNSGSKELKKIDKDVLRISGVSPGIDVEAVEAPDLDTDV
tara:strand:- start:2966 stop:4042 length:1077 start_codon:yes stop_codon:yes gene_type:complete